MPGTPPVLKEAEMAASLYTVSFVTLSGEQVVSRNFSTLRAARKWAGWLVKQPYAASTNLYQGREGENLLETLAA
jgi:hypothetical protein